MSYPVSYYCPHCGTLVELDRDGYLADKSVTPYPLDGWTYVAPAEPFEEAADGVRFVCGESDGVVWDPRDGVRGTDVSGTERSDVDVAEDTTNAAAETTNAADDATPDAADRDGPGCGEPFYLSFVRYEEGHEIDPRPETELVEIDPDPRSSGPRGPRGPQGPDGPNGTDGGFR
ncbi:hypothetical protein [Halorubrum trueperi]|uniref:DUF7969 domain-containing protein n=1 Tax=Halorubrum trueperi TaxID=2004704 RepID=A0ABD5UMF1_9EURY